MNLGNLGASEGKSGGRDVSNKFNIMTIRPPNRKTTYKRKKKSPSRKRRLEKHHVRDSEKKKRKIQPQVQPDFRTGISSKQNKKKKKKKKKKSPSSSSDSALSSSSSDDEEEEKQKKRVKKRDKKRKKRGLESFKISDHKRLSKTLTPKKRKKKRISEEGEEEKEVHVIADEEEDDWTQPESPPIQTSNTNNSAKKQLKTPSKAEDLPHSLEADEVEKEDIYVSTPEKGSNIVPPPVDIHNPNFGSTPLPNELTYGVGGDGGTINIWDPREEEKKNSSWDNKGDQIGKTESMVASQQEKRSLNRRKKKKKPDDLDQPSIVTNVSTPTQQSQKERRRERRRRSIPNTKYNKSPEKTQTIVFNLSGTPTPNISGNTGHVIDISSQKKTRKIGTEERPIEIPESPLNSNHSAPGRSTENSPITSANSGQVDFSNYDRKKERLRQQQQQQNRYNSISNHNVRKNSNVPTMKSPINNYTQQKLKRRNNNIRTHHHRQGNNSHRPQQQQQRGRKQDRKENREHPKYKDAIQKYFLYGDTSYLFGMVFDTHEIGFSLQNGTLNIELLIDGGKPQLYFKLGNIEQCKLYEKNFAFSIQTEEIPNLVPFGGYVINKSEIHHFFVLFEESFKFLKEDVIPRLKKDYIMHSKSILTKTMFQKDVDHALRKTENYKGKRTTRSRTNSTKLLPPPPLKEYSQQPRRISMLSTGRNLNDIPRRNSSHVSVPQGRQNKIQFINNNNSRIIPKKYGQKQQRKRKKKKMTDESDDEYDPNDEGGLYSDYSSYSLFSNPFKDRAAERREKDIEREYWNKIKGDSYSKRVLKYKNLVVTNEDMRRLRQDRFLNDTIMDFYLLILTDINNLKKEGKIPPAHVLNKPKEVVKNFGKFNTNLLPEDKINGFFSKMKKGVPRNIDYCDCHIFNTTFYQLIERDIERCARRVPDLKIEIFKKKYLFIPINKDLHWTLSIVIFDNEELARNLEKEARMTDEETKKDSKKDKKDIMLYCDSLGSTYHKAIIRNIRKYMKLRYQLEKFNKLVDEKVVNGFLKDVSKVKEEKKRLIYKQQKQREKIKKEERKKKMKDEDEEKEKEKKKMRMKDEDDEDEEEKKKMKMKDEDDEEEEEEEKKKKMKDEDDEDEEEEKEVPTIEDLSKKIKDLRGKAVEEGLLVLKQSEKWEKEKKFPHSYPRVEEQTNSSDCGVFVLSYVEYFAQRENFLTSEDFDLKKEKMFYRNFVRHKRMFIRELIFKLAEFLKDGKIDEKIERVKSNFSKMRTLERKKMKNSIEAQISDLRDGKNIKEEEGEDNKMKDEDEENLSEEQKLHRRIQKLEEKKEKVDTMEILSEEELKKETEKLGHLNAERKGMYEKADRLLIQCAVKINLELKLFQRLEEKKQKRRKRRLSNSQNKKKKNMNKKKKRRYQTNLDEFIDDGSEIDLSSSSSSGGSDVEIIKKVTPQKRNKKKRKRKDKMADEDDDSDSEEYGSYFKQDKIERNKKKRKNERSKKSRNKKKKKVVILRISDEEDEEEKKKKKNQKKKKKRKIVESSEEEDDDDEEDVKFNGDNKKKKRMVDEDEDEEEESNNQRRRRSKSSDSLIHDDDIPNLKTTSDLPDLGRVSLSKKDIVEVIDEDE